MRVGIMTMHRVPNYGSFMQAYSLKRMIERLGHQVVFVDYHVKPDIEHRSNVSVEAKLCVRDAFRNIRGTTFAHALRKALNKPVKPDRATMFSCDEKLGVTESYHFRTRCDSLVIGSDEVFNCLQLGGNVGFSPELFGTHARAGRVFSYAASFGNTTLEKLEGYGVADEVAGYLRNLDAISVRDENSSSIVTSLTGTSPLVHLDPVLVGGAERDAWRPCDRSGYVILYGYSMRFSMDECQLVMDFAHRRGLKVLAVGEDQPASDEHLRCRPDEVLPLFSEASYVVTDTFHGTIFSVVTHRPFVTLPRGDRNNQGGNVQKLTFLLRSLGLQDRMAMSLEGLDGIMDSTIDFGAVDMTRQREAERSISYLREQLDDAAVRGDHGRV